MRDLKALLKVVHVISINNCRSGKPNTDSALTIRMIHSKSADNPKIDFAVRVAASHQSIKQTIKNKSPIP